MNSIIVRKSIQNMPSFQYEQNIVHTTTQPKDAPSLQYFLRKRNIVTLLKTVTNSQQGDQYQINLL